MLNTAISSFFTTKQSDLSLLTQNINKSVLSAISADNWTTHYTQIQQINEHAKKMQSDANYAPEYRLKIAALLAHSAWCIAAKNRHQGKEQAFELLSFASRLTNISCPATEGFIDYVKSTVHRGLDEEQLAVDAAERALLSFKTIPNFSLLAQKHCANQQALALIRQGNYHSAIAILGASINPHQEANLQATSSSWLNLTKERVGRIILTQSQQSFIEELICVGEGVPPHLRTQKNLAQAYIAVNNLPEALSAIENVLDNIDEKQNPIDYAYNLTILGEVLIKLACIGTDKTAIENLFKRANTALLQADKIYTHHFDAPHPNHLRTKLNLLEVFANLHNAELKSTQEMAEKLCLPEDHALIARLTHLLPAKQESLTP